MRISQIVTSSDIKFSKRVHAFTEQGVAMLYKKIGLIPFPLMSIEVKAAESF
jgi:SPX domain protein involved in polyphosphate accumulation